MSVYYYVEIRVLAKVPTSKNEYIEIYRESKIKWSDMILMAMPDNNSLLVWGVSFRRSDT